MAALFIIELSAKISFSKKKSISAFVRRLSLVGEMDRSCIPEIKSLCSHFKPNSLVLDTNIAEHPSFYKQAEYFDEVQVLYCYDNNFLWVDVDLFPNLVEIHSIRQTDHTVVSKIKNYKNITKLIFKDCHIEINQDLKDFVFGDYSEQVKNGIKQDFQIESVEEIRIIHTKIGCDGLEFDFTSMSAMFYPNLVRLELHDFNFTTSLEFLSTMHTLQYFTLITHDINFLNTLPPKVNLRCLYLKGTNVLIPSLLDLSSISTFRVEADYLYFDGPFQFPNCCCFYLANLTNRLYKVKDNYYLFMDNRWSIHSKEMALLLIKTFAN